MLKIKIPETELWDPERNEFITVKAQTIALEHSLVSVSKWESKWCKPFLSKDQKTAEMAIDYIKAMTITQNVNDEVYLVIRNNSEILKQINEYIEAPMTATWFSESNGKGSREIITSEVIYYWMVSYRIPVEFQKWHLNRLLTLIRVCSEKNSEPKKMSASERNARNRALNEARRKRLKTHG